MNRLFHRRMIYAHIGRKCLYCFFSFHGSCFRNITPCNTAYDICGKSTTVLNRRIINRSGNIGSDTIAFSSDIMDCTLTELSAYGSCQATLQKCFLMICSTAGRRCTATNLSRSIYGTHGNSCFTKHRTARSAYIDSQHLNKTVYFLGNLQKSNCT